MTRPNRCSLCGATENIPSYNLCAACLAEVSVKERAAQGLPPKIEEPSVYDLLARLAVNQARRNKAAS